MIDDIKTDKIKLLVAQIEEENIIYGESVGFCGEKTEQ